MLPRAGAALLPRVAVRSMLSPTRSSPFPASGGGGGAQACRPRFSSAAAAEAKTDDAPPAQEADPMDVDRNPLSTKMRQCRSRHEVALFMAEQDPARLMDTQYVEAARLMANYDDSPLTSQCGRMLEVMANRMQRKYIDAKHEPTGKSRLHGIVAGKEKTDVKKKAARGLSTSVGQYIEFAQYLAQIYHSYRHQRGGVVSANNPLRKLARDTVVAAVDKCVEHEKDGRPFLANRPQQVPTALLALGLLDLKAVWTTKLRPIVCGQDASGQPNFEKWLQTSWDIDQVANVLYGCIEMDVHKSVESRRLIERCLQQAAKEEMLVACTASTLTVLLRLASRLKERHGPIAEASNQLFDNAQRRITSLATTPEERHQRFDILSLPATSSRIELTNHDPEVEVHSKPSIKIEDYNDSHYLVGAMTLDEMVEVVQAYNSAGRTRTAVHEAVAGKIVSVHEIRESLTPSMAAELVWIFYGAYKKPLYDVLCIPLSEEEVWRDLKLSDLHRVLLALHETKYTNRYIVHDAIKAHLHKLLSRDLSRLTPAQLSNLRNVLTKVDIGDEELLARIDEGAI
ncbi:hypothetical protein DIPPA_08047 [Diplonema papillatum]|nr:hypothetical protein DIPPA_08047 [Diplonema papillatum]